MLNIFLIHTDCQATESSPCHSLYTTLERWFFNNCAISWNIIEIVSSFPPLTLLKRYETTRQQNCSFTNDWRNLSSKVFLFSRFAFLEEKLSIVWRIISSIPRFAILICSLFVQIFLSHYFYLPLCLFLPMSLLPT